MLFASWVQDLPAGPFSIEFGWQAAVGHHMEPLIQSILMVGGLVE